jgi:hypothetical protein
MCPVMRGFEEIGCFFYKGLLKGLGWGRENWRSLGTWNRRENFEVTSQVLFFISQSNMAGTSIQFNDFLFQTAWKNFEVFPKSHLYRKKNHVWLLYVVIIAIFY